MHPESTISTPTTPCNGSLIRLKVDTDKVDTLVFGTRKKAVFMKHTHQKIK